MSIELDLSFLADPCGAPAYPHGIDPAALAGVLFAEDFDLPELPPAVGDPGPDRPAVPPLPVFAQDDIDAARATAREEGRQAALQDTTAREAMAVEAAARRLIQALADAQAQSARSAGCAADDIRRLVMQLMAAALPELCAHHGPREAAQLTQTLLPMLRHEPRITIRASPHTLPGLRRIADAHRDAAPHGPDMLLIPTDALAEGDVSIEWQHGGAVRDTRPLLRQIAAMIGPGATAAPAPTHAQHQELADVG